jgi:thioredoxin-like negative regulator of GroEL
MREFVELTSLESVIQFIEQHRLAFLYFSSPNCSVCHSLKPQIQTLMVHYPEIQLGSADVSEVTEIAGTFSVFTVPVLLLFVEGKEYIREARIIHTDQFNEKINKIYQNFV